MPTIEWFEPTKTVRRGHSKDVYIMVAGHNGKRKTMIYFYGGSERKITHEDRLIVGLSTDRIFFKEAAKGYKLKLSKSGNRFRVVIPAVLEDWEGEYDLQYHEQTGMWFVGRSSR